MDRDEREVILPNNITLEDYNQKNTVKLKEEVQKEIYLMQLFLYSQGSFEWKGLEKQRKIMEDLEEEISSPEFVSILPPKLKMQLYSAISENKYRSLKFLQDLHKNATNAMEQIKDIEKDVIGKQEVSRDPRIQAKANLIAQKLIQKALEEGDGK